MLSKDTGRRSTEDVVPALLARVLRLEWIGQTGASLFWIASVVAYGISSAGDCLQLTAASAWLVANIAAVAGPKDV